MKIVARKITLFLWAAKIHLRVHREAELSFGSKEGLGTFYTAPRDCMVQRTPSTVGGSIVKESNVTKRHGRPVAHA